ncbi:hypothetical protein [Gordonia insulae]|uniref:Uncharacterized protein n=1 Tax=Gordonia insulae TaxID=2420509 RepID=A0A3G8JG43_9ACTN|nr:hypothetical protein [Gordonia insulae]AZG43482.1 hypothetical protein D7316_00047 [Gordonia insulae]
MSAPTALSVAESTGRLIEQITEFIGENASMTLDISNDQATVWVHRLDVTRFPLHNEGDPQAGVQVTSPSTYAGHLLYCKAATLLGALQAAAAYLVFPPQVAESHLRIVGGAS